MKIAIISLAVVLNISVLAFFAAGISTEEPAGPRLKKPRPEPLVPVTAGPAGTAARVVKTDERVTKPFFANERRPTVKPTEEAKLQKPRPASTDGKSVVDSKGDGKEVASGPSEPIAPIQGLDGGREFLPGFRETRSADPRRQRILAAPNPANLQPPVVSQERR